MSDILITPNRGSTNAPTIQFSGSVNASASIRLEVLPEGQVAFLGKSGSLFSISDSMSGSLMAVSDISGLPILEVFSDDKVVMGKFNANTLIVTGSQIAIGKAIPTSNTILDISGSVVVTGSANATLTLYRNTITAVRTDYINVFGTGWAGVSGAGMVLGGQAGMATTIYGGGTASLVINTSGNVGIGTTTPNAVLDVSGSAIITGSLSVIGNSTVRGKQYIKFDTAADGIYFISGSGFTQAASILLANSRVNFTATTGTTPSGFVFNTGTVSNAVLIRDDGSLNVFGSGSFGKTTSNAVLDVNGNTIITGSLTSSLDANIATMTVGRGKGSIATNTAIGYQPLYNNTTGDFNTAIGYQALLNNTYGFQNTALGASALAVNVSGSYNIAISQAALNNNKSGSFNIAIGGSALSSNVGADSNIAVGYQSLLFNNTGDSNIGIGKSALLTNVSGRASVAVGSSALTNSTGDKCIGVGHSAGSSITSGVNNIVIGNSTTGITTGANNVVIGNSVTGLSTSLANTIIIADGAGNIRQYIDSSGNMSLGKTSPINAKLDVSGDLIVTGSIITSGNNGIYLGGVGGSSGYIYTLSGTELRVNTYGGMDLKMGVAGADYITVKTGGNVGINKIAPNAQLDVNGNTIITGSLTVTGNITGTIVAAAPDFSPIFMMMGA